MNEFETTLYKNLFDLANLLLSHYDPCKIGAGKCAAKHPFYCCSKTRFRRDDPEDKRCLHLSASGCTFPNLECKVWLCRSARRKADPQAVEALRLVEEIAKVHGMIR